MLPEQGRSIDAQLAGGVGAAAAVGVALTVSGEEYESVSTSVGASPLDAGFLLHGLPGEWTSRTIAHLHLGHHGQAQGSFLSRGPDQV